MGSMEQKSQDEAYDYFRIRSSPVFSLSEVPCAPLSPSKARPMPRADGQRTSIFHSAEPVRVNGGPS